MWIVETNKNPIFDEPGKSQIEIAKIVKCSRCAVQSTIERFIATRANLKNC